MDHIWEKKTGTYFRNVYYNVLHYNYNQWHRSLCVHKSMNKTPMYIKHDTYIFSYFSNNVPKKI